MFSSAKQNSDALVPQGQAGGTPSDMMPFGEYPETLTTSDGAHGTAIGSIRGMLWRRKWTIVAVLVLIAGTTIPAIWLLTVPTYRSTATVRVSPVVSRLVFRTEDNGIVPLYKSFLNTQVSDIRNPIILQRVLDRDEIRDTVWYQGGGKKLVHQAPTPLERLSDMLSVRGRPNTELIDVSVALPIASEAKRIVDAVVDEYKKYKDETERGADARKMETLANERLARRAELDVLIKRKYSLAKKIGATAPEQLRSELSTHLSQLDAMREEVSRELEMAQWKLAQLTAGSDATATATTSQPVVTGQEPWHKYVNDSEWRRRRLALDAAQHDLDILQQEYGKAHPQVKRAMTSVEHAGTLLSAREAELDDPAYVPLAARESTETVTTHEGLERLIAEREKERHLLDGEIERQRAKVEEASDIAMQIAEVDEQIARTRELYDAVHREIEVQLMEGKAPARIQIAAHGLQPTRPSQDRRLLLTGLAFGGALMCGVGLAYLRGATDTTIREVVDIRSSVQVPFLGQLPRLASTTDLMAESTPAVVEAVRMVRTALLERLTATNKSSVLVTSPTEESGKTSLAILLTKSLAQLGKRTLLVEVDLWRPSLATRLGSNRTKGLAALLTGHANRDEIVVHTNVKTLDIIFAGEETEGFDPDLLANGTFSKSLAHWKSTYDFVVLDGPPVLPVADARILAGHADGAVMVLRASHCRQADAMEAYAHLCAAGATLFGTILTGSRSDGTSGYYAGYGSYRKTSNALPAQVE